MSFLNNFEENICLILAIKAEIETELSHGRVRKWVLSAKGIEAQDTPHFTHTHTEKHTVEGCSPE